MRTCHRINSTCWSWHSFHRPKPVVPPYRCTEISESAAIVNSLIQRAFKYFLLNILCLSRAPCTNQILLILFTFLKEHFRAKVQNYFV